VDGKRHSRCQAQTVILCQAQPVVSEDMNLEDYWPGRQQLAMPAELDTPVLLQVATGDRCAARRREGGRGEMHQGWGR